MRKYKSRYKDWKISDVTIVKFIDIHVGRKGYMFKVELTYWKDADNIFPPNDVYLIESQLEDKAKVRLYKQIMDDEMERLLG